MIVFDKVTKHYGSHKALDDVSFSIRPREFVILVGPSGAGKTTLIKLLLCEEKPTFGRITIDDKDIHLLKDRYIPYYRRQIGVVFQDFKLLPNQTVAENVAFAMEVSGKPDNEITKEVMKILELVGLKDKASNFPRELSGGEIQRVAIARALVFQPKFLIADEPTGNLDPVTAWDITKLLLKINSLGTTVLLATHNREIVDNINKRVINMDKGRVVRDRRRGKYDYK
ncbi:TPA: cell division ATP-binding protein FtsE [Patescibacteria group bacterium]|uniref:Cell division ATP-binding protein FtsE n=2 Tax=Bacteria division Kazan-3B-28 TaxID=1798534 RepID=A0A0G1ZG60_UNCK3|nr:MAG: cell division ATP-binding protein FtsE, cell division transport system ATP-binding protein [candidate division Kazan bacterium GW2011_GWA1_50_15]KKW25582.1 MAG: Cell division ATP-binding protein FtsE [candidate division Kazan bacterium GW2011_GWC1_52_13]KKW26887.1 MAG: Cell division ATP-binding protein FtsE [candidate division Kazan bacterium GW2011_GWB1_52_7]HAV66121.1 cell division ATP-binding protein FtsE [Patescibacteria group bacterium]HCL47597.1 cell division ATP-binding protein F